jgi:hypothetical protein
VFSFEYTSKDVGDAREEEVASMYGQNESSIPDID